MYDLIAIGDATLDVFVGLTEAAVACDENNQNCKLELGYGDKIPAESLDFIIGGNAINAAIGARRLGISSALLTTIGGDETGRKIIDTLHKQGVNSNLVTIDPKAKSNYSVVLNFRGERTIIVYHLPRTYSWKVTEPPKWFYVTSMGEGFEPIYDQVWQMTKSRGGNIAFNPGTHQLKKGLEYLAPFIKDSEILFLNREEAAELLKLPETATNEKILASLFYLGVKTVVMTDGTKGSYAFDGTTIYYLPIFDGPEVERTGAGDSYATAFTVAIYLGKPIPEAMRWGNCNSRSVVAQIGPEAGLLNAETMNSALAQFTEQPVEL